MTAEEWRPIPGAIGYEVSDQGQVRSYRRGAPPGGRVLNPTISEGYYVACIHYADKWQTRRVHQLVLEAFIGPRPEGTTGARHLNDVKTDNRLTNLAYGTHAENMLDRVANGIHYWARRTHCIRGHEYTPENTVWRTAPRSGRTCRECRRILGRESKARTRTRARRAVADGVAA